MHKVVKAFKYRIYPTKRQQTILRQTLDECRWLYNHLLEQRKVGWEERQATFGLYDQIKLLPELKGARPSLTVVYSQVLQNVAVRIDLAFKAFFRRVKAGEEKPGFPRFRGRERYDSFCYPQYGNGCKIADGKLYLSKVGVVKIGVASPHRG